MKLILWGSALKHSFLHHGVRGITLRPQIEPGPVMSEFDTVEARAIRITFNNGEQRSFAFEPKNVDTSVLATRVQEHMDRGFLALEKDDRMIIVPMSSVQTLEIAPKPEATLPNAIRILHEFGE